jgi:hypothetical protein
MKTNHLKKAGYGMMKMALAFAALFGMAQMTWADDPSEKGVPTSPLTIYSGGFAVGGVRSLTDSLKAYQKQFFKVSFVNTVYFREHVGVFFDLDWMAPGNNFGGDLGFDFQPFTGDFRPFFGAGVGARYFDKKGSFGDNIGPSGTVHVGFAVDLSKTVQMRIRIPYNVVINETTDQCIGLDIGFLFSDRYRTIKKLNYN